MQTIGAAANSEEYYVQDGKGNVTTRLDDTGDVVANHVYTAYGDPSQLSDDFETFETIDEDLHLFAALRLDVDSGLYSLGGRPLDPELTSVTTRGAGGMSSAGENPYIVAGGDPVNGMRGLVTAGGLGGLTLQALRGGPISQDIVRDIGRGVGPDEAGHLPPPSCPCCIKVLCASIPGIRPIADHCWFEITRPDCSCDRYEVWAKDDRSVDPKRGDKRGHVYKNLNPCGANVGAGAARVVYESCPADPKKCRCIADSLGNYEYADSYNYWPGPNSNTYVARVAETCDIPANLPPSAVGQNYQGAIGGCGGAPGICGVEGNLGGGIIGGEIGLAGIGVHVLGGNIGINRNGIDLLVFRIPFPF